MSVGETFGRHRMDRTLDEIAAEMNSGLTGGSGSLPFGQDYEERDYIGAPIRGSSSSFKRHTPYSTSSRISFRDRERGTNSRHDRERSMEREESSGTRVFVANLSYSTTWQTLKDHMKQVGPVVMCHVFRDPSGNSRGMGLCVYEQMKTADAALKKLTNTELDGRKVYLRKDMQHEERERKGLSSSRGRGKPLPNPASTVFVGNLDYGVTWQKLKDVFKVVGPVANVDIMMDRFEKSKGCAEVQFDSPTHAINSIALFHGQMMCDRPMTVRMDSRAPFQPDPLELKLSTLANVPSSLTGRPSQRSSYIAAYEQKAAPTHYSASREADPYPRRISGFVGEAIRQEYHESPRGYANYSPPRPVLSRATESSHSFLHSSSGMDLEDYRNSSRGGHSRSSRGARGDRDERDGRIWRYGDRRSGGDAEGNRRLFVKNLNYSTSWQHLKDTFRGAGSVQHVDIMEGSDRRPKGCAIVWFDNPEDARKAIDMFNDYEVDSRRLEVRYDRMG